MVIRLIYSIGLAVSLALGGGTGAFAQSVNTIRLTTGDWQPFTSKTAPNHGFAAHIVTEAFALAGVQVTYGFYPWKRAMKLARDGNWEGSIVWSDTEARREDFYYSDPLAPAKNVFFHLKASAFDWSGFEDLAELRVGGTEEYSYGAEFEAAEKAGVFQTSRAISDEAGLTHLLKGRIDLFPGEVMVTYAQIRDAFPEVEAARITHHPRPISERPLYLLLSKQVAGNAQMVDRFNEGLRQLRASGRYDQIIADGLAGKYTVSE